MRGDGEIAINLFARGRTMRLNPTRGTLTKHAMGGFRAHVGRKLKICELFKARSAIVPFEFSVTDSAVPKAPRSTRTTLAAESNLKADVYI
jgi:hypothetical protein